MTMFDAPMAGAAGPKPKIAVLGEFSSGKSTLANVLLGRASSPVRVTATQLPPIWYTYGAGDPVVVDSDGGETEITIDQVTSVPVEGTKCVRVFLDAPILQRMDFIDMPGSSDPNMSPDIWNAILPQADAVIWCTPATQAWRQSEAAIWDEIDPDVQERSILLVTRIDKVLSEADRARLMKRLRRETAGSFRDIFAVDLMSASHPQVAGSEAVSADAQAVQAAIQSLLRGANVAEDQPEMPPAQTRTATVDSGVEAAKVLRLRDHAQGIARVNTTVIPRRVGVGGAMAARRPRRTTGTGGSPV